MTGDLRFPRISALLIAISTLAYSQSEPTHHLRGTVRSSETGQPVAGAAVKIASGPDVYDTQTGPNGEYSVTLPYEGGYTISVSARGQIVCTEANLFLAINKAPDYTVDVPLCRSTSIGGVLIDSETKRPVANLRVQAYLVSYSRGTRVFYRRGAAAITDTEGRFEIGDLRADTYFLQLDAPSTVERATVIKANTVKNDDERPILPTGYPRQFWPATGGLAFAAPLNPTGGSTLKVGEIRIGKVPLHQLQVSLPQDVCSGVAAYRVRLNQQWENIATTDVLSVDIPCGEKASIANLASGDYSIDAAPAPARERGPDLFAYTMLQIRERDEAIDILPKAPLSVTGQVEVPAGIPGNVKMMLRPMPLRNGAPWPDIALIAGAKPFVIALRSAEPTDLILPPLPPAFYVSEILYNGVAIKDSLLDPNPYAPTQQLKMTISSHAAVVSGHVTTSSKVALPQVQVILLPWPLRMKVGFPVYWNAQANASGEFSLGGLPPDNYRALAVSTTALGRELQMPGALAELAKHGVEVQLGQGEVKTLTLDFSDLRR